MTTSPMHNRFLTGAAALGLLSGAASLPARAQSPQATPPAQQQTAPSPTKPQPVCAQLNAVPATDAFKTWNDFHDAIKGATEINADLGKLTQAGTQVCIAPQGSDFATTMQQMHLNLAYNFDTHFFYALDKTPPAQIAAQLPKALEDALTDGKPAAPTSDLTYTPDSLVTMVFVQSLETNILNAERSYELAQAGFTDGYDKLKTANPDFVAKYEQIVVNAPVQQSHADSLYALFAARMANPDTVRDVGISTGTQALDIMVKIDTGLRNGQIVPKQVPDGLFKDTFNPADALKMSSNAAEYLTGRDIPALKMPDGLKATIADLQTAIAKQKQDKLDQQRMVLFRPSPVEPIQALFQLKP